MLKKSLVSLLFCVLAAPGTVNAVTIGPPDKDPWYMTGYILGWVSACSNVKYSEVKTRRDKVKSLASDGKIDAIDFGKFKQGWGRTNAGNPAGCSSANSRKSLVDVDAFLLRTELAGSSATSSSKPSEASVSITDAECDAVGMGRGAVDEIYVSIKYDAAYKSRIIKEIGENRAKKICLDKYRGNRPSL